MPFTFYATSVRTRVCPSAARFIAMIPLIRAASRARGGLGCGAQLAVLPDLGLKRR